jgi:23S rRNA pseudoU1915 N3-methylase RlmH
MDKSDLTIDDYIKEGTKEYTEVLKAMAKLNLIEYLKKHKHDNRNKVQHRRRGVVQRG